MFPPPHNIQLYIWGRIDTIYNPIYYDDMFYNAFKSILRFLMENGFPYKCRIYLWKKSSMLTPKVAKLNFFTKNIWTFGNTKPLYSNSLRIANCRICDICMGSRFPLKIVILKSNTLSFLKGSLISNLITRCWDNSVCIKRMHTYDAHGLPYFISSSGVMQFREVCYTVVLYAPCVCLYVLCGHLLGKGWPLGSRLWCLTVSLSLSHWYPGSGVVLDCIDSWSLHPYLHC